MRQHAVGAVTQGEAAFQARLRARDGVRPQSTLAILAGYAPGSPALPPTPAIRQAVRQPVHPGTVMVPQALPARAPGRPGRGRPAAALPAASLPATAVAPDLVRQRAIAHPAAGGSLAGLRRLLFSGLAAIGLAGLAVLMLSGLARERQGAGPDLSTGGARDDADAAFSPPLAMSVSALAIQAAADQAGQGPASWFDYRGAADYLSERAALYQAGLREAERIAQAEAERLAQLAPVPVGTSGPAPGSAGITQGQVSVLQEEQASLLAEDEAARLATEEAARAERAEAAALASQAEAARLARLEAERVAALQQAERRIASLEEARAAEAAARLEAEEVARRLAAEAEALRLARAEAERAARLAEERLAIEIQARRAAEAEVARLAALEMQRLAEMDDMRQRAEREARRIAEAEAARLAAADRAPAAPVVLAAVSPATVAATPPVPAMKPSPDLPQAASRKPDPAALPGDGVSSEASSAFAMKVPAEQSGTYGFKGAAGFIAERASLSLAGELDPLMRSRLEEGFLDLLAAGIDGRDYQLDMPGGTGVMVRFEQTRIVDPAMAEVRRIGDVAGEATPVVRPYGPAPGVDISVMCRDVSYAVDGFERGRFAACQGEGGGWLLARPSGPEGASA